MRLSSGSPWSSSITMYGLPSSVTPLSWIWMACFDWMVAAVVVLVFELAQWQLLAFTGTHGPFAPLLIQVATTVLAYPAIILFCASIQRRFAGDT